MGPTLVVTPSSQAVRLRYEDPAGDWSQGMSIATGFPVARFELYDSAQFTHLTA